MKTRTDQLKKYVTE